MTQGILNGRYELEYIVGHGGMAEVWRGYDRRLERIVAVKVLRAELASDESFVERLRREAHSVARLNHPNIVAIYDAGGDEVDGVLLPYLVMEFVNGQSLGDVLRDDQRLPSERALEIAALTLDALDYSHRAGFVHRDIKPGNIMLTDDGGMKLMDFGIARAVTEFSSDLTRTAQVLGTARYLSPEQATGSGVDGRSDLYSTGCLLFELLTGRAPYVADSALGVIQHHVQSPVPSPADLDPEVSEQAAAVVMRAMAKDPADRYQTAAEMRAAIESVRTGRPVEPVQQPRPVLLYGLVAAAIAVILAGGTWLLTDTPAPASDPQPLRTVPSQPGDDPLPGQVGEPAGDTDSDDGEEGQPEPLPNETVTVTATPPAPEPSPSDESPEPTSPASPSPTPSPTSPPSPSPSPTPSPTSPSPSPGPTTPAPTSTATIPDPEQTEPAPA